MSEVLYKKSSLMGVWSAAWRWMREEHDIELNEMQSRYADSDELELYFSDKSVESMAYFLTEHFENKKDPPPDHLKSVIQDYKVQMMETWNWPDWGYKSVKHLKSNKEIE